MSVKKSSQKTAPARPASKTTAKAPASKKTVAKKPSAPEKKAPVAAVKKPAKKIVEAVKEVAEKETAKRSLIAPAKRGRKAKTPPAPVSANAGISVPRDVKAMNASFSHRNRARAYNPFELEQLLFQRGVTNINIFNEIIF